MKIAPPPARTPTMSPAHKPAQNQQNHSGTGSEWGEFASASQQQQNTNAPAAAAAPAPSTNASWVQF